MTKYRFAAHVVALVTLVLLSASVAQAQATRTWVSGVGDDANPCSRSAPCKTWAGAISKTAPGGEINALDPGGFGAVTITKSITIDGGGGQIAGILVAGTTGLFVNAGTGDTVFIRNIDFDGLNNAATGGLNGISIIQAKAVHIDHCNIYGFSQDGVLDNRATSGSTANQLFINDTLIRNNGAGVAVIGSSARATEAFIDSSRIQENASFGISGSHGNAINVLHSNISRNIGEGVKVDTTASATIIGCIINSNSTGALNNGSGLLLADTTIINNGTGVSGTIVTFGNNNVRNNGGGNSLPVGGTQQ